MKKKTKLQLHIDRHKRSEKKKKQSNYIKQTYQKRTEQKIKKDTQIKQSIPKKRKTKVDYRQDKINWLIDQGYDNPLETFSLREIDSLHISDIRKGTLLAENVPFLNKNKVNFNRVKLLKDELDRPLNLKIAYRSLSWNNTLNDIIPRYTNLSNENLVELAKKLLRMPKTYQVDNDGTVIGTSSGKDGEVEFRVATPDDFTFYDINVSDMTRRNKKAYKDVVAGVRRKRVHSGDKYNVQFVKLHNKTAIDRMSFRECLMIYCAVAENIVEQNRQDFSHEYYYMLMNVVFKNEVEILEIPKPKVGR